MLSHSWNTQYPLSTIQLALKGQGQGWEEGGAKKTFAQACTSKGPITQTF